VYEVSDSNIEERLKWIETRIAEIEMRLRRIEEALGLRRYYSPKSMIVMGDIGKEMRNMITFIILSLVFMIILIIFVLLIFRYFFL